MAISVFSPQVFLSIACGELIEPSAAVVTCESDLPQDGIRDVDISESRDIAALWIHGIVGPTKQREAFIEALTRHELPAPIVSISGDLSITHAHYLPLEVLQTRNLTLAGVLGLTTRLVDEAARSRSAQCARCETVSRVFHSAEQLCDVIATEWRGEAIEILLRGPHEALTEWADEQGLHQPDRSSNPTTLRLDSFVCDDARCQLLQSLLASTRRYPHTWIHVRDSVRGEDYAWHGRCTQCDSIFPPFKRALLVDALSRGNSALAPVETSRLVWGIPLSELLNLSLENLASLPASPPLLPPRQTEAFNRLGIAHLSLSTLTSSLPPHTIARIPLATFSNRSLERGEILVIDSPLDLLSHHEEEHFRSIAREIGTNGPVVWLRQERLSPRYTPQPFEEGRRALGTITRLEDPTTPFQVRCGELVMVGATPAERDKRLTQPLLQALRGESTPHFSFEATAPFAEHLLPLFSIDSSHTRLVAHELGVIEPLSKLFAASHQAKMLGLSSRDFVVGQARHSASVCETCKGSAFMLAKDELLPTSAAPCSSCWGTRFRALARDVSFKGKTLWEVLNAPLNVSAPTLRALPKMREIVELATLFEVTNIPLGMPTALLPRPTRRLLSIIRSMIAGTTSRPSLIIIEEPFVGLSPTQAAGVIGAITTEAFRDKAAWVGVTNLPQRIKAL